ncbi:hypothetical protein [uncultured Candidatus Kuenenia sp.]|jgi:AGZA family xanthine/uracil permease-like MFS transporter|uniref:hypothetical protein n=1 Tax=uncultured Candidatus Kuenenia sp. TaxID=1048336 RepID=UPI0003083636|nr:hypothetical protein [uncultured Candidatus Kuenenia sp.]
MPGKIFKLRQNGTNTSTETVAGSTTFLTMSYIIFVQPAVLSGCGMDFGAVMTATCISSAFACILMALLANYPIPPAFYYLLLILSFFGLRELVIFIIPDSLKSAIAVGIGLLIALVGFDMAELLWINLASLLDSATLNRRKCGYRCLASWQ